ncbi:MAG: acyl-CoA thioesterase YbgC [Lentisphaerae bacterium ADurb.Bin242]|nr:MAG: acyl-CoA thioesterase YbgC [Lentisphaerae bacterium ADurb.Bin242]
MSRRKPYFEPVPGAPPPVTASVSCRITIGEVDALGIVWHGNYPFLFEKAAAELGDKCGLTYAAYRAASIGAPLAQFHVDYCSPLYLDEIIEVSAFLHWSEGARLNMEFAIRNSKGETACTAYSVQLFVDLATREPLFCSPELWENCKKRWLAGEFHREE